jgi:ferredoxin-nitrite reductase
MKTELPIRAIDGEPLSEDQTRYLSGFFAGISARGEGVSFGGSQPGEASPGEDLEMLSYEERVKREQHPLDAWDTLVEASRSQEIPAKEDLFRFKWHGLFHLTPVHGSYMARLRIPGGWLRAFQMRELAAIAEELTTGYVQVTTRSNLQMRLIPQQHAPELVRRIQSIGLHTRGAGADNVRNLTASPTAGVDPAELVDVRPLIHELGQAILNDRQLADLPRKFNIAYDGGGAIGVVEDTNDIGVRAVRAGERIGFRIFLGGATGHGAFASDIGVFVEADRINEVVLGMTRVFAKKGDRSDRKKARLKHLLEARGLVWFLTEVEAELGWALERLEQGAEAQGYRLGNRHAHVGAHPQKQEGLYYFGATPPVGQLTAKQMRRLAELAEWYGDGEIRLTVWQSVVLTGIAEAYLGVVEKSLKRMGFGVRPSPVSSGVVACTGNRYCKYAQSDTKGHAARLMAHLEGRVKLDTPVNIHLTGCPHSCAQHAMGDIGLLGAKVKRNGETVDGYHVFVGGGFGANKALGRQVFTGVPHDELDALIERMLKGFLRERREGERFQEFTARMEVPRLQELFS